MNTRTCFPFALAVLLTSVAAGCGTDASSSPDDADATDLTLDAGDATADAAADVEPDTDVATDALDAADTPPDTADAGDDADVEVEVTPDVAPDVVEDVGGDVPDVTPTTTGCYDEGDARATESIFAATETAGYCADECRNEGCVGCSAATPLSETCEPCVEAYAACALDACPDCRTRSDCWMACASVHCGAAFEACARPDDATPGYIATGMNVSVANLTASTPIGVYVDGFQGPVVDDLAPGDAIRFTMSPGTAAFTIRPAGSAGATPLAVLRPQFPPGPGEEFLVGVWGDEADEADPIAGIVFREDRSRPPEGTRYRVFNGAPIAPTLNVWNNRFPPMPEFLASAVAYGTKSVDRGAAVERYVLALDTDATDGFEATFSEFALDAGDTATMWVGNDSDDVPYVLVTYSGGVWERLSLLNP